jgi:hypothetical protein
MADLHIENYDFTIIDFNELLINDIQPQIINSLHEFNLLDKSINNLQLKSLYITILYTIYVKGYLIVSQSLLYTLIIHS